MDITKRYLTLNQEALLIAFRGTIGVILGFAVAMSLHLDKPYWCMIGLPLVIAPHSKLGIRQSAYLIIGTLAGSWMAVLFAPLASQNIIILAILSFCITFIGVYLVDNNFYPYPSILMAVNCILIMSSVEQDTNIIHLAFMRTVDFCIAVGIGLIVNKLIFP